MTSLVCENEVISAKTLSQLSLKTIEEDSKVKHLSEEVTTIYSVETLELLFRGDGSSLTSLVCEKEGISATASLPFCIEASAEDAKLENLAREFPTSTSIETLELLFQTPVSTPRSEVSLEDEQIKIEAFDQESTASSSLTSVTSIWSEITNISLLPSLSIISIASLSSNCSSDYAVASRGGSSLSSHDSMSINSDEDNVNVKPKVDLKKYRTWGDLTSIVGNELGYDADTLGTTVVCAEAKKVDDRPDSEIDQPGIDRMIATDDMSTQSLSLPSRRRHRIRRRLSNIKKSVSSVLSKLCCFCF